MGNLAFALSANWLRINTFGCCINFRLFGFSLRSCLTETIISGYNLQLCLTEVVMPSNKKPLYRFSFLTDSAAGLPAYEHGTKKMQRIHFRTNHFARVTGQRRVFFRVSGRVVTMVEASRFSWRVYVPSWLTNAERDSSKDARS